MNITTLSKCVEELKKDNPNISYVLGMLETVIEMNGVTTYPNPQYPSTPYPNIISSYPGNMPLNTTVPYVMTDEEVLAQKYAGGQVGNVGTI